MSNKIITILGGNGYVAKRVIKTLLNQGNNIKIYAISRNPGYHHLDKETRVEYLKGDALHPEQFSEILFKSTGVLHSIGILRASNEEYNKINYLSAIKPAEILNIQAKNGKKNFVYISAERGLSFPLSLAYSGYINSKRKAEKELLKKFSNLKVNIIRPGLIVDSKDTPYLLPFQVLSDASKFIESKTINKITPNIGEKIGLPPSSIQLDIVALYAAAAVMGNLNQDIYSNDYMNDLNNLKKLKFKL